MVVASYCTAPVSYTHLDVYKRQILLYPVTSNKDRGSAAANQCCIESDHGKDILAD